MVNKKQQSTGSQRQTMKCSTEENVDLVNDLILSHEDTPQTQSVCLCVYACLFDRAKAEQC